MASELGIGVSDEIARLSLGQEYAPHAVTPPVLNHKGIVPVDITEKFIRAAKTLAPGDVVKDDSFTLMESVSALEIMDPKMDSGYLKPGDEFEELYDVSVPLAPEQVLGIIDQLICHEMSWHLGYPLSQTLLSSVYVEALLMPNPLSIDQARFVRNGHQEANEQPMLQVLRAYCLGMLKACGYVNERIRSEHYYEEEDFVTNTYNRTLLGNVPTQGVRTAIADAKDLLNSLRDTISDDILGALKSRLELRDTFLSAAECPQNIKEPTLARIPWKEGIVLLPSIRTTHSLGKPVEESFSVKLQRKLASTIPPRPILHLAFDDAFGHLLRLFQDGLEVIGVLEWTDSQCLQTFVSTFQSKKPQPLVYVRTLLQTFIFNAMEILGTMSIRQLIDDDLSIITLPASLYLDRANDEIEVVTDPRFIIAQQMELFRRRAAQPFLDIFRTFCQNRSRTRRTLTHIIRDWESLQVDAEEVDQVIQLRAEELPPALSSSSPVEGFTLSLSSWVYLYKLRQMEWIVQLGFELEVYQVDELNGMYWYLNFLSKCRLHHAERIKTNILREVEAIRSDSRRLNSAVEKQLQRSLAFTRLSLLDAAVTWEFSDALSCLYTVLARLGLIQPPVRPYSNDELRYEIRMKPFAPIGLPELPSFDDFTEGTVQQDATSEEILTYGEKALTAAKQGFEAISKLSPEDSFSVGSHDRWVSSAKNSVKSCIAASLAFSSLKKAMSKAGNQVKLVAEVPTPDKAYHEWWIVPRLVPVP